MKTKKQLWLDLEDTVIHPVTNGWGNTQLMNIAQVKEFIGEFKPDELHIFSYALWNPFELRQFNHSVRSFLEERLGLPISLTPLVDDEIVPGCCRVMGISPERVTFSDASDFWSKQEGFRLFMRHLHSNTWKETGVAVDVVLLDDIVIDETWVFPKLHLSGRTLNIDTL